MLPTYGYPLAFLVFFAFVTGACVGSFLNVVIARVPFGDSVVWPPSHCLACGTAIKPFHNVPVLSWFWLRGRCRACLAPFSVRYALVEAAFGLICAFAVARHGLGLAAAREVVLMGFLVPLSAMDLDHWILPEVVTWPGVVTGLVLTLAGQGLQLPLLPEDPSAWQVVLALFGTPFGDHLLAAALGYTSLLLVGAVGEWAFKKEALGGGDLVLLALIGAFLGTRALLPVVMLASVQGVLVGLPMVLARRRQQKEEPEPEPKAGERPEDEPGDLDDWTPDPHSVPFGPFLSLGAAEVLYFSHLPDLLFPLRLGAFF